MDSEDEDDSDSEINDAQFHLPQTTTETQSIKIIPKSSFKKVSNKNIFGSSRKVVDFAEDTKNMDEYDSDAMPNLSITHSRKRSESWKKLSMQK